MYPVLTATRSPRRERGGPPRIAAGGRESWTTGGAAQRSESRDQSAVAPSRCPGTPRCLLWSIPPREVVARRPPRCTGQPKASRSGMTPSRPAERRHGVHQHPTFRLLRHHRLARCGNAGWRVVESCAGRQHQAPLAPRAPRRRLSARARPGCFAAVARQHTRSVVTLLLRAVYRCPPQSRRSSSSLLGQERQHERRRTRDPGCRTLSGQPCTANRPTAGRAASESAS